MSIRYEYSIDLRVYLVKTRDGATAGRACQGQNYPTVGACQGRPVTARGSGIKLLHCMQLAEGVV